MSYNTGPKIVTDGLIMHVDAASHRSYATNRNLINWNEWTVGGTPTGYGFNQTVSGENALISGTDPWGNTNVVWETRCSGDGNADGGWGLSYSPINISKLYRFSVWMKRTSSSGGGTFYFGTNGTGGAGNIGRMDGGADEGNPYWHYEGPGAYTQNVWYLFVAHIYPYGTTYTGKHPDSGVYTISGGKLSNLNNGNTGTGDLKWLAYNTGCTHRVYHYYCGDNTTRMHLFQPRLEICDGTEPSISQLLNSNVGGKLTDLSGNGNDVIITGAPPYSGGKFTLNGSTHGFVRTSAMNGVTGNCTVVLFYNTLEAQELWVMGNQSTGWYLSASNNNNYYHSNCGSPSNYVDLVSHTNPYAAGLKNGAYHMWEAKNVNFTSWTYYDWFLYPSDWQLSGNVSVIMVYNRELSAAESRQNYEAFKPRFNLP